MLQIYDRVLASHSVPTLLALTAIMVGLYLFMGVFEWLRSKVLSAVSVRIDQDLMSAGIISQFKQRVTGRSAGQEDNGNSIQDLNALKQFFGGKGLPALFDLPWTPVYLAIVYLLHPLLGLLATAGAVIVVLLTLINEFTSRSKMQKVVEQEGYQVDFAAQAARNADSIYAMGMLGNVSEIWEDLRSKANETSYRAANPNITISAIVKTIRMIVQSGMLGLGAYLAIYQEITPGTMIAASILAGRALSPIDLAIANWPGFLRARLAYKRLKAVLASQNDEDKTGLPTPQGLLEITGLVKFAVSAPGVQAPEPILQNINFKIFPGDGLGIIGPSGAGKSTLAKIIAGVWMPDRGEVRLDGATYDQWPIDILGRYIGYLPQTADLLPGTIRQNIARFDATALDEEVIAAARLVGMHEVILKLPSGYDSVIGSQGSYLSGGQVQRIALARAVFRLPKLVVLDEPNSHLDGVGEIALNNAVATLRKSGSVVITIVHHPSALAAANKVLVLQDGKVREFGNKDDVLPKVMRPNPPGPQKGNN